MDVDEYENEHSVDLFEERLSRVGFNVQSGDYDKFENRCYKIGGKAYADCCASYALRHHGINWGYVDIDFCFFLQHLRCAKRFAVVKYRDLSRLAAIYGWSRGSIY